MSDKSSVIPNICSTEPQPNGSVDVIWSASDFQHESCLPVIGSCQVSSILSTLENGQPKNVFPHQKANEANSSDSVENVDSFKSIPINIINSDSVPSVDDVKKRKRNKNENLVVLEKKQLFQEMVYFGCNLCPFICTKDCKITDHIKSVHKNKDNKLKRQLKCPGCPNIFYHKLSLRSHLIHDHEVGRSDINKIVNSIFYSSVLADNDNNQSEVSQPQNGDTKTNSVNSVNVDFLPEINSAEEEELENSEENVEEQAQVLENDVMKAAGETEPCIKVKEYLPKQESNVEGVGSEVKEPIRRNSFSKPEEQKRVQKCCISTCAVRMYNVVNMSYHVKCHYGKIFRCLECGANFVIWKTLQTHLWRSHNIDMELYSCDKCDYKTYSLAKLNNIHKLIHGNEKPFLCDLCGKGFKNPKQLRNHKIVHKVKNLDKMQRCSICDRAFADKRLLKVHIAGVHQKIKPFSCNYCGYKAASNGALKLHIRQHTGEKPFSCDNCDYSTADHNSLRRHKSRHSGEKKYKCIHCDYACIQSSTYKTHLRTKHPGLENEHMFCCPYCQFRSVNKDKYMIHIASHNEKKKSPPKFLDIIRDETGVVSVNKKSVDLQLNLNNLNLVEQTDDYSLQQKVYRISKKQMRLDSQNVENTEIRLQETPVALISKIGDNSAANHCIILPVQNENVLNLTNAATDNSVLPTTTTSSNSIQYFYGGSNVLLEIIDEKAK